MLSEGRGDLVTTLVVVDDRNQLRVDFSEPLYADAKGIVVSAPGTEPMSTLEDLSGKGIYFYKGTVPYRQLIGLSNRLEREGKAPITVTAANANLQREDLLEMVDAGLIPSTVAEQHMARYWAKIFSGLRIHSNLVVAEGDLAWAMQKNTPRLRSIVNEFVESHKVGTAYGNTIAKEYLNDVKWAKGATAGEDLARFKSLITLFRENGRKYDFPYILLAAQGYQESGLNQNLRSTAGAVGIMQIKPQTAAASPIFISNIDTPGRNIEAGAKYLRYIISQYYADSRMGPVTKGLFALASYNAGPNRIQQLRKRAEAAGYDPDRWFNNVEMVVARDIGRETVQYVGNIFKYYLAYKLVLEQDARREAARAAGNR